MKINNIILYISLILLISSCGEDRTYEYEQKTEHNIWIYEQMKDVYLWGNELPEQDWKKYFAKPQDYFQSLIKYGDNDNGSYILIDSLQIDPDERGNFNHFNSYGFDYTLIEDPTETTTRSYARVLTVYEDSPASRAGLKRNDFIESYDNYKLTKKNVDNLKKGKQKELVVKRLTTNEATGELSWKSTETITISASECVEDKPFPVYEVISYHNEVVGYLMCNRLMPTSNSQQNGDVDYSAQLDDIMDEFYTAKINHLILDLRLCNSGTMEMARRLSSYIIPSASLTKVFAMTKYNKSYENKNSTILFDSSLAGKTLELDYVVVITDSYTKGPAEWAIRALQFALGEDNVLIVGGETAGQEFLTEHCGDYENMIHIYPAVAYVTDGNGDYDADDSGVIKPKHKVNEFASDNLYDYGDINEILLSKALYYLYNDEEPVE